MDGAFKSAYDDRSRLHTTSNGVYFERLRVCLYTYAKVQVQYEAYFGLKYTVEHVAF